MHLVGRPSFAAADEQAARPAPHHVTNPKQGDRAMADPVIHFEIIGKDAADSQKFYADLFGWDIDADNPLKYGSVAAGDGGIGGGVGPTMDGSVRTMFYVGVEDLQAKIDAAQALGAKTVMPP